MTYMNMRKLFAFALLAMLATAPAWAQNINAAGATFPYPIYSKWFDEYHKLHPNVQINYQSIGSGGGIRQLLDKTVDFGASDGPMTDDQLKQASVPILHFPTVIGADVPTYNIPGIQAELNFTSEALAGIFLGKITKWNDPELVKANPSAKLPATDIIVVHRYDGSGTSVNWPVGLGGKGNEGVSGQVQQTPNSIGYVELIYAVQNKMKTGKVKNLAGKRVHARLGGVNAAAAESQEP